MDKFDLRNLGVKYTVLDKDTQQTELFSVIDADDLKSLIGEYSMSQYDHATPYIKDTIKRFTGFAKSPFHISWYSAPREEFDLSKAIIMARKEGNNIVVTEILLEQEVNAGYHQETDTPKNL